MTYSLNLWLWLRSIGLCVAILLGTSSTALAAANNGIIAVFLYNFSNFIEWPPSAFQRNANLEICLLGDVDFADTMRNFEGTPIRGHPLRIVATQDEQMVMGGCHILYVGLDRRTELQRFLKNLNHMFVLSVGENDKFIEDGGTINIVRTSDQAQFSIDLTKAIRNGLSVSSDLLELATVINEN
jgi:hypothetical protein